MRFTLVAAMLLASAIPAAAQLDQITRGIETAQKLQGLVISEQEERQLGAEVSERIRTRYGVVQDRALHTYVSLVGTVLAQGSRRPALDWQFIVLDTDAVNAFAAPGGFVHVTRGALALARNEAELAGVLAHEIAHVVEKHTVEAIQKNKLVRVGADETLGNSALLLDQVATRAYELLLENAYDRNDEEQADRVGVELANKAGWAPRGLADFLGSLAQRNQGAAERRGLFASHPQTRDRIDRMGKLIASNTLAGAALVEPRYREHITFEPVAQADVAQVDGGAAGLAGGSSKSASAEQKQEPPKKKGFGLSRLTKPLGGEKQSAQVSASGGARGVDPERDAKGGSNPTVVTVTLTSAEISAFRQGISD
jgi:predicted Zn-dependent protease